mgnify:CR=1 FL=1
MSTHDYNLANQSGASFRSDLNNCLAAILSNNSNGSAPSTTVAYSIWADTSAGKLKIRNAANDGFVDLINLDGTIQRDISLTGDLTLTDKIIHSGDTNTAIRFPSADTFTIETAGSERLRVDSSGNVGIGATPSVTLDIESTTPTIRLTDSDASGTPECEIRGGGGDLVFSADRDDEKSSTVIEFHVDGSEKMRVDTSGRLGLGTTSPTHLLHLESASTPALKLLDTTNNATLLVYAQDADIHIGTYSDHPLIFDTNSSERVRIAADGKVGIGTSSPLEPLDVILSGATRRLLFKYHSSCNTIQSANASANNESLAIAADNIRFNTGSSGTGSEAVRIDNSGHFLIGSTSSTARLHVEEDAALTEANPHVEIRGSAYALYMFLDSNAAHIGQNSAHRDLKFYSGTSTTSGAQLTAGATSFTTYSDERLKKNIKDIGSVLDKISDIRCVSYIRKDIENFKETIGFVAQDFVNKFDQVLDSTKIKESDTEEHLGIKYTETIPILLKAIQELSAKVAALEAA